MPLLKIEPIINISNFLRFYKKLYRKNEYNF
jgi:hypothetical protein